MALSNYDTFVVNHKGESCKGEYISPIGVKVEVYKNWLYIHDEKGWHEEVGFVKPIVMEINSSILQYKDITIVSKAQEMDKGNFITLFCCWVGWEHNNDLAGIVGICRYDDILPEDIDMLKSFLCTELEYTAISIPDMFRNIDLSKCKRYNQGDMFFHNKIGTDTQCTLPGEAKKTIFEQIFDK